MKITIEMPEMLLKQLEREAVARDVSVSQLVSEALAEKLQIALCCIDPQQTRAARIEWAGKLRHLRKESARISAIIEKEFEHD